MHLSDVLEQVGPLPLLPRICALIIGYPEKSALHELGDREVLGIETH
jgi:hypothetical protein